MYENRLLPLEVLAQMKKHCLLFLSAKLQYFMHNHLIPEVIMLLLASLFVLILLDVYLKQIVNHLSSICYRVMVHPNIVQYVLIRNSQMPGFII